GGLCGWSAARCGGDGCGLWLQHRPAHRRERARIALCRRHPAEYFGVGARYGTAAAEEVVGARATTEAHSPRRQASTGSGQGACAQFAQARLAHDLVARRLGRAIVLALCPRARSCRASCLQAHREPDARMAVDRVARRRERADQILALDPSQGYHVSRAGRPHQAALADRARLSGTQAGGWAWAFRGQRMARLPPPRHAVHHRLRFPGLREGDDSPLWTSFRQAVRETYGSQRLPTQRLRRCEPNDTSRTRSRHCAYASASPSPADYRDAHAAQLQYTETYHAEICDTVVLVLLSQKVAGDN